MDRYEHTLIGLWIFGAGYAIHYVLYPVWRKRRLPSWSHVPLGILAWLLCIGLLLPFKDFVVVIIGFIDHPSMGFAFETMMFLSLFILMALVYQNSDFLMLEQLRPFLGDSLFFRHTRRVRENIFGQEEQKRISDLAVTRNDRAVLEASKVKDRVPMDRSRELHELEQLRTQRKQDVGKDELIRLNAHVSADITDVCKLQHVHSVPHPTFEQIFRLTIDPNKQVCQSSIVYNQRTSEHVKEPKRWFRFRQDLFDHAHAMFYADWMEQFRPYYTIFEIECHQEETDSFGLPRTAAFLRVDVPVKVLEEYKDRMFIATDLENVATVTWLEGETT